MADEKNLNEELNETVNETLRRTETILFSAPSRTTISLTELRTILTIPSSTIWITTHNPLSFLAQAEI